ncbi:MAG: adenylate/guanylate cyclase domain-containing protein [Crocinitomicaceae bacterium]|nr:adenylate/guanylate cyclase domain-containing protein [Crocinitomicaceae bacterium]MCF8444298.1 adenylate/guanylate cyclase domain-containing protein [Crocinitomicaceae bacterium]
MTATNLTWEADLEKSAAKYHTYGAWIAIIFDPIFGITDYLNIPHAFQEIMLLRIGVAVVAALSLLAHKHKYINSKMLIFIPFILISFQNAYTFSVIQVDDFTGHSLNYLALFIGAGMFVLWNWYYSLAIILPSILATGYFFQMNHQLNMNEALINGGLLLLVVTVFMFILIETRYRLTISMIKFKIALMEANDALGDEKAQSDKLLRNILPDEVADELKATGRASAKHYQKVSVLFTDFKGFTARSASMTPEEVIEELNKCFSAFDEIVEKYNLEKIKTIGDAYMCAGGLPVANQTNHIDAIRAGLAIQEYMTAYKNECIAKGEPYFECRLGINTGEVVAGVVGTKKFAYDIWGDTVNTASRAESNGSLGKVNITETTYELVKDIFKCEYRGDIEVKGKGPMKMYFVME